MELIFNELSVHGQFADLATFRAAIGRVMGIRRLMQRCGRELYCHRGVVGSEVMQGMTMPQAVQALDLNSRRALMQWLTRHTRHGPFWEDAREHGGDDYLDCFKYEDRIVTDTAVGEAAFCTLHGLRRGLVSLMPSSWQFSPVPVELHEDEVVRSIEVRNYWDADRLAADLENEKPPLGSWQELEMAARNRCRDVTFSSDSFEPLHGHPFHEGAADRVLLRLLVLQRMRNCFDGRGERTTEGHALYRKHFTGAKAWFSDSSASEKNDFADELRFPHPSGRGESLFCTWHGKVKWPQLRIHFSWPIRAVEPLYVVYVGPKITKR